MLKAIVSYSKKVPVPDAEYSSQGFSLSLETEITATDPTAMQAQIHETFEVVKASVEEELQSAGAARESTGKPAPRKPVRDEKVTKATNKQVKYITDLWTSGGGSVSDLNARVRRDYRVHGLYDLDRKQASDLVDQLKNETRQAA